MMQANCKNQQRPKAAAKAFRIELEPVNDWIGLDGIEGKISRMAGGVGLRVLSVVPMDETGDQAASDRPQETQQA